MMSLLLQRCCLVVKHDSVTYACNDDVSLPYDSEVVFARQKCVASGYLAGDNADLNDFVDAEIRRLEEQTAKLKRSDDTTGIQLASGSRRSSRATSSDLAVLRRRLQFSTARYGDEQPSAAHLDMPLCDQHGVGQAGESSFSTLRRPVAPRHDNDRQSSKADRFSEDAEVVDLCAVPKHFLSIIASDHKKSVPSEVDAKLCRAEKAVSKRSAAVKCDVSSSSDNNSNAAESDKVLKCVKFAVKKSKNRCGNKSKSVCVSKKRVNVESVLSSLSDSDIDESVATKMLSSSKARATGEKSVYRGVSSKPKSKVNTDVNEKSKVNHSKLSHVSRRQRYRGKSVEACSESESNTDKRSTFTRHCTFIRPDVFDGVTPSFATFKAHF